MENTNHRYKSKDYWDERYGSEDSYEWFTGYPAFRHIVVGKIKKTDRILVLGCGNSLLSKDLYDDGYTDIVNVDYSKVCIDKMKQRYRNCPGMEWRTMDIRKLDFQDSSFDVVLEKGTIDSLLVEEKDPWNVSEEAKKLMHNVLNETSRVLKTGGHFISVTFGQPHFRRPLLAKTEYNWSIQHQTFGDYFHYFVYSTTKGELLSLQDLQSQSIVGKTYGETEYLDYFDNENFLYQIEIS